MVNQYQLSSAFSLSSSAVYCVWYPSFMISSHLLTSSEGSSSLPLFIKSFVLSVFCCLKVLIIVTPLNSLTALWRRITGQNPGRASRSLSSEPVSQTSESADFHQTSSHMDELCSKSPIKVNEVLLQFQGFVLGVWLWSREREFSTFLPARRHRLSSLLFYRQPTSWKAWDMKYSSVTSGWPLSGLLGSSSLNPIPQENFCFFYVLSVQP